MKVCLLPFSLLTCLALGMFFKFSGQSPSLNIDQKIADATPASLPQGPIAKTIRSELSAFRLKGRVKQATGYHSDAGKESRQIDYDEYYSEAGFRTKSIQFLQGYPFEVTNYGFIDGCRVSTSKYVVYGQDDNPFTGNYRNLKTAELFTPKDPKLLSDERYQSRIETRYDNLGRYIGGAVFHNNGEFEYKVEIRYHGDREDIQTYFPDADYTWHRASKIDHFGNVVETQYFNEDGTVGMTEFLTHTKFDSHGNWLECSVVAETSVDGKSVRKPMKTMYRLTTYYENASVSKSPELKHPKL